MRDAVHAVANDPAVERLAGAIARAHGIDPDAQLTFARAGRVWPGREAGRPLHVSGVHRAANPGIANVRLGALRVPGSGWTTTIREIAAYVIAVDRARRGQAVTTPRADTRL